MPNELASRLEPLVAEAVEAAGFDLDALDVQQAGRRKLVKVVVDGDDGVGLDEVAEISRAVSAVLDANEHLIAGAYTLEVTSPGTDRPLTKQRHWRRAKYRQVRITPTEGAEYVGRVGEAAERSARVLVAGTVRDVSYADVVKAVIEIEFKQPPAEELRLLEADASGTIGDSAEAKEESR
ncbi:ribosome maturation factor RimP [Prauserella marina]|uniref:Ribosome maturation factor RimP n=1 Tax=Prauserella marina TaxID=530584 RepID=A0A222VN26_9PSEU|nr:ribosome maturation factor RimP [Prauserella marina]ASR35326.1 ribosome maturation factor RimP [Prauserella marina]PWV84883.1 ribosome maturation factor RimP [Prauserella marina]SDC10530.1 ribosome maturation factor RimP [Prauserella marina]